MEYQIGALIRKLEDLTEALRNDNPSLKAHSTELAQLSHAAEAFARESNGHLGYVAGIMVEMAQVPAISLLVEWGAFQHIPFEGTISYRKLAGKLDADAALIGNELLPPDFQPPEYSERGVEVS